MAKRPTRPEDYRAATARANAAIARLGVLSDQTGGRAALTARVELFLWRFLRLRWHDIHRFLESVENKEAMELSEQIYRPGMLYQFLSERQDDHEWENTLTVGLSLLFAARHQAQKRGFDPRTASGFTLERMLEQAIDDVDDLEDLLARGTP